MYHNNAKCDIYIGKSAGKKLMHEIEHAKHSVKIISPYLSPYLIKRLIRLHKCNIHIELITTDYIEDYYGDKEKNIYQLILQKKQVDEEAQVQRNKWKKTKKILNVLLVVLVLSAVAFKFMEQLNIMLIILAVVFIIFLFISSLASKIRKKRIYSYHYKQLFPFKVFLSPNSSYDSTTYIHSKMYIIDNRIAYLGSLNFTKGGTQNNHETRIRTSDNEAVEKIIEEFEDLFYNNELLERNIQFWGQKLYREPIN